MGTRTNLHELHELARRQLGLVTRSQLNDLGLEWVQYERLATGAWERLTPNVFAARAAPVSTERNVLVAALDAGGDARVGSECAAALWGIAGFSASPVRLVTTRRSGQRTPLATTSVVRELPQRWVTELRGIPVVRPEFMLLQLCASVHPLRAERALDNAWKLRLVSGRSLGGFLSDLGRRGRNGTALLRRLLDERGMDYRPPDSNVEGRVQWLARRAGLEVRRQVDVGEDDRWVGRVDFLAADRQLVIEVQSELHHSALTDRAADAARLARLAESGFVVVELVDSAVWVDGDAVVEILRQAARSVPRSTTLASS